LKALILSLNVVIVAALQRSELIITRLFALFSERSRNEPVLPGHRGCPAGVLPDAADRATTRTD